MDVIYIIALLLFLVLVYILIISIRNLLRLKKELKEMTDVNRDMDISGDL